jgi:spore coat protein U-like protein
MMPGRRLAALAAALGFCAMPQAAQATCAVASLCACSVSATTLAFGSYDPLSNTPTDSTATVTVDCILVVAIAGSFDVALSTGSSGSFSQRKLSGGTSDTLNYNLYTNASRTTVWGDGSGGSSIMSPTFTALLAVNRVLTVYGRIPARQNVASGPYNDTITVTVTY